MCVCVFLLVVAMVVFDEVLQQVDSSLRLYLIDLNQILREEGEELKERKGGCCIFSKRWMSFRVVEKQQEKCEGGSGVEEKEKVVQEVQ